MRDINEISITLSRFELRKIRMTLDQIDIAAELNDQEMIQHFTAEIDTVLKEKIQLEKAKHI